MLTTASLVCRTVKMTSEGDNLKTNEFLRLRKLRLQQVREQSKDIAKKIRQRAKVEQLRNVTNFDPNKEKLYQQTQEKLVNRLEKLYSEGLKNVGVGHKNASELNKKDIPVKKDLSKLRGKEAVAELRRKKQEQLDEHKKVLDRKLQAREAANELSREKSVVLINNLAKSSSTKSVNEAFDKALNTNGKVASEINENTDKNHRNTSDPVTKNDMATQWDFEELPNEWEPNVPSLSLPKDDSVHNFPVENTDKTDKSKRLNLFALSDEMPSSLRGGIASVPDERVQTKPSLTLVSEYLQTRGLRLREPDLILHKRNPDDLQSIKQTLLKTRVSRTDVTGRTNNSDPTGKSMDPITVLSKKSSVTMYDHNTKDIRELPHNVDNLVVRDQINEDDAYSKALKEASMAENRDKHKIQQETRHRIAVSKQNIDKEYQDTLAFLNSLPKERPARSVRTAYMDGDRQQELNDRRQQRLQQEYKNVEKECRKHSRQSKCETVTNNRSKSKSPYRVDIDNNIVNREFQYSWLPVPESDNSLAIHTVPTNTKEKHGNSVKFSSVDTYHEYRSRHKHTPPTKDNEPHKRVVETVIIQENSNDSMNSSSETNTSSIDDLQINTDSHRITKAKQLDDAEKIIIYKVMDSKKDKTHKRHKRKKKVTISNTKRQLDDINININQDTTQKDDIEGPDLNAVSFSQLKEGVYKSVSANGDNITSMYFSDDHLEVKCNQHNVSHDRDSNDVNGNVDSSVNRPAKSCSCRSRSPSQRQHSDKNPSAATSATSFKSAFTEKAKVVPDGSYIKFVNEGGQDARKFYVGASGCLQDDEYEVVIQLRKKEAEKTATQPQDNNGAQSTISKDTVEKNDVAQQPITILEPNKEIISTNTSSGGEITEKNSLKEKSVSTSDDNVLQPEQVTGKDDRNKAGTQTEAIRIFPQNISLVEPQKKCDKSASTSFHNSFVIPENPPEPVLRPATSTYTQTTPDSPVPRPVFMHLSSSTSTTYMSPPELVLPKYFRKIGTATSDDTYEQISSNLNSENSKYTEPCKHSKCSKQYTKPNAATPPNTARSTDPNVDNFNEQQYYINNLGTEQKRQKPKHHKCKKRSEPKISSKQKFKRGCSDRRFNTGNNYSPVPTKKSKVTKHSDKPKLNPVIENYIKRLLSLNKEGLKAIDVINQECSGVNTPGSSIIDMPSNVANEKSTVGNKISIEQIKNSLKEQILKDIVQRNISLKCAVETKGSQTDRNVHPLYKLYRKRFVHKVKSLNISRQLQKTNRENRRESTHTTIISTSPVSINTNKEKSSSRVEFSKSGKEKLSAHRKTRQKLASQIDTSDSNNDYTRPPPVKTSQDTKNINSDMRSYSNTAEKHVGPESSIFLSHRGTSTNSSESDVSNNCRKLSTPPISISTQTHIDSEVEFMKRAENKLQNMEKIADLTEKCTKRLSNLAKVLEEVRRNKSLAYSQISTPDTSESDQKSDKVNNGRFHNFNPTIEMRTLETLTSRPTTPSEHKKDGDSNEQEKSAFVPVLTDIPKPDTFKTPSPISLATASDVSDAGNSLLQHFGKNRGRPPPALTRINLKNAPDDIIIPHELSTVVEVDSPMSVKLKSHTTRLDSKQEISNVESVEGINLVHKDNTQGEFKDTDTTTNNVLISNKLKIPKTKYKKHSTDSSDESKIKMMDLKQFNEIMLKPFISLQDYARKYNLNEADEGSTLERISKLEQGNEDLSSVHSDASIPDIVAELLKRNLIREPFKFETTSATVSSESTMSMLALSRAQNNKTGCEMLLKHKENLGETSESLSMSSNPDLENAFQRLGMGWASSTLKKTKERLALSSSSNSSSSSMPQFKVKSFNYQDAPDMSKDTLMSFLNVSKKKKDLAKSKESSSVSETLKNAVQQTSISNSMTVKEFLTNELSKKITFSNKSNRNITEDDFISLCETKMPDEIRQLSYIAEQNEKSGDTPPAGTSNRARTSTPVQIFKSLTYHSTSSSNTSNGLFSNADDLSSVKITSNSNKYHSTSDKDDLTIPNYSLKMRKGFSDCSKSD